MGRSLAHVHPLLSSDHVSIIPQSHRGPRKKIISLLENRSSGITIQGVGYHFELKVLHGLRPSYLKDLHYIYLTYQDGKVGSHQLGLYI